jgi:hypothetical protein
MTSIRQIHAYYAGMDLNNLHLSMCLINDTKVLQPALKDYVFSLPHSVEFTFIENDQIIKIFQENIP